MLNTNERNHVTDDSGPGKLGATFKAGTGFEAQWVTVRADSAVELNMLLQQIEQVGVFSQVANLAPLFAGAYKLALGGLPTAPVSPPPPAQPQPQPIYNNPSQNNQVPNNGPLPPDHALAGPPQQQPPFSPPYQQGPPYGTPQGYAQGGYVAQGAPQAQQGQFAPQGQAQPSAGGFCQHGARVWASGTAKSGRNAGKPWYAWDCPVDKRSGGCQDPNRRLWASPDGSLQS